MKLLRMIFFLSLSVNLNHKKVAYTKKAISSEPPTFYLLDECKRKLRIAAGGLQSLQYIGKALNAVQYPRLTFQFFSHKILRCLFCAPAFILLFASCFLLWLNGSGELYTLLFQLQIVFYILAFTGWILAILHKSFFIFTVPFYIVFMHAAMLTGMIHFFTGKQSVLWEKVKR